MPTGRAYVLLTTSFLLYLFANQTQVGWLYVMSALLIGIVLMAWWMNRRMLPTLQAERRIGGEAARPDLHAGAETIIELHLRNQALYGAYQLRVADLCPLAAPEKQLFNSYAPIVPGKDRVTLSYTVTCDRRGLHIFSVVFKRVCKRRFWQDANKHTLKQTGAGCPAIAERRGCQGVQSKSS